MNRETLLKSFGIVLRQERNKKGLSQEQLALTAEVDRTFVSQIERGINQPSLATLWKLCETLETRPSAFLAKVERMLSRRTRSKPTSP